MSTAKRSDARRLTLREAYCRYYDDADLAPSTVSLYDTVLRQWERWTGDPAVGTVDNQTVLEWKRAALAAGLAPITVNKYWTMLRAIFRRLAKPETGNPAGVGVIDRPPYLKPCKVQRKKNRRVNLNDLSRFYLACNRAEYPKRAGVPAPELYRALLVVGYCTGLRRSDLLALEYDSIDLQAGTLDFTAQKTGKAEDAFPLHPAAVEHLKRIHTDRRKVFRGIDGTSGTFDQRWRELCEAAGVEPFGLQHVRSTAASEINRVSRGMGSVLLQHRPMDVTGRHYLDETPELAEAVRAMRLPVAFKHGPTQADNAMERERRETERLMREADWTSPRKPDPSEWRFHADPGRNSRFGSYWFRGKWRHIGITQWRVLKALAESPEPVDVATLVPIVYQHHEQPAEEWRRHYRTQGVVSALRKSLREEFGLPKRWDTVPCTDKGSGGKWTLCLPPASRKGGQR